MRLLETGYGMDFRVYEATPGVSVLLRPDAPVYSIVTVSNDFVALTGVKRVDLIGKSHFSFLSEGSDREYFGARENIRASFEHVIATGTPYEIPVQRFDLPGPGGVLQPRFWRVNTAPVMDDSGKLVYLIHTIVDVTDKLKAEEDLASIHGIREAYRFFVNAPVIIGYVRGDDYVIDFANEGLLKVWQRSKKIIGTPLLKAIPEFEGQGIKELLDQVRLTGKPFHATEHPLTFVRGERTETRYFDFVYQPFYENENDKVASGVISVGHDVSEQVQIRHKFRNVLDQAQNPILILKGREMTLDIANEALLNLWQIDRTAIGKPFLEILPEMKDQGYMEILQRVYDTGEAYHGYEMPAWFRGADGIPRNVFFNFIYQPYREPGGEISGVLVMASDATAQVLAKREMERNQRKWKDIANSMPVIVWAASGDGRITFFNDQWYHFTGLTEAESMDFNWTKVLHPDDLDRCLSVWRDALAKEKSYEIEARYRAKDGHYSWVIARGVPIKQDGKFVGWYGTSTDIDKLKQLESTLETKVRQRTEELEAKNKLLDNILKNSSNGITVSKMIFDEAGNVVDALTIMANDAAVKFSGLPRDLYLTKTATEFDPNIIASPYGQKCISTLKTGEPSVIQYFLEFTSRWLELTISKMDDRHLIHIFTDVTPIKQAQLQLEKTIDDLKFANANLEEFAYAASHDLKEPVRKIQLFAGRLKEGLTDKLDTEQNRYFERLESSTIRMMNLIDDLLEYSQAASGTAEPGSVDLNQTLTNVLEDLEIEIAKKQAAVSVGALPEIKGNSRQMHQLFQNLISNSLKYSQPVIPPEIRIVSRVVNGRDTSSELPPDIKFHCIEVTDNGIGFDQKYADGIFKLFTRLHSDPQYKGSGIGLSIVKKVVENHHGYIFAKSRPGHGATFTLLLPA